MRLLVFALLLSVSAFGQTPKVIKSFFYNLPVDSSRSACCNFVRSNNLFTEHPEGMVDNSYITHNAYWGKIKKSGMIFTAADSADIEITFGACEDFDINQQTGPAYSISVYRTTYYYSAKEKARKDYDYLIRQSRVLSKQTSLVSSSYFNSYYQVQISKSGESYKLLSDRHFPVLEIGMENIGTTKFAVIIDYSVLENQVD